MASGLRHNSLRFVIFAAALFVARDAAAEPPVSARITSIMPKELDPRGGQLVTITGLFRPPVRVFFDLGEGTAPNESPVVSVSPAVITAVVPQVDVGPLGWRLASVIVIAPAGIVDEQRATLTNGVRFVRGDLMPSITIVSPRGGPRTGGTRATVFGSGFHEPVQVFTVHEDGAESEMQVMAVSFDQVTVLTPRVEQDESVGMRIVNVGNGRSFTLTNAFRYIAPMSVTSVMPSAGPYNGGTRVTIEGSGFAAPVALIIGGIPAQPIKTTDQQIIAVTGPLPDPQCTDHAGVVVVVNIDDDSVGTGPPFTFTTPRSEFRFVPSQATAGGLLSVIVKGDGDLMRFQLDDTLIVVESRVDNSDGSATYRLRVPADVLSTRDCRSKPLAMALRLTNPDTGCHDTRPLFILPEQNSGRCRPPRETP
jgi:hypothetical protein